MKLKKLIIIGGPTGVGKTKLAITLAKKFQSEIFNLCPTLNTNRYDLSKYIFKNYFNKTFYKKLQINKIDTKDLNLVALRPLNSRMDTYKISSFLNIKIKNWKYYLKKYLNYIKRNDWWKIEKEFF